MKQIKIADFISTFKHFDDEEKGIKPYTIRDITPRTMNKLDGATHVRIRRGYTSRSIIREITHKLEWKDNVILAWNPNIKE